METGNSFILIKVSWYQSLKEVWKHVTNTSSKSTALYQSLKEVWKLEEDVSSITYDNKYQSLKEVWKRELYYPIVIPKQDEIVSISRRGMEAGKKDAKSE